MNIPVAEVRDMHILVMVVARCIPVVAVRDRHILVMVVVMGMVVGDKVFDVALAMMVVEVLRKVVVMEVVEVLHKVVVMEVVVNGLVVEVSELEEVVGVINMDIRVEEVSEVVVVANEVVVEANELVVEVVSYSSKELVVVGRIQEPVEVVVVVNLAVEEAET